MDGDALHDSARFGQLNAIDSFICIILSIVLNHYFNIFSSIYFYLQGMFQNTISEVYLF